MKHTKKTLITTETSETLTLRLSTSRSRVWCEACGADVEMISPEVAARNAGVGLRAIFRLIETRRLHFKEMPNGSSLVCLKSVTEVEPLEGKENV